MTKEDLKSFYSWLESEIQRTKSKTEKELANTNSLNFNYYLGNELAYETVLAVAKTLFGKAE